MQSDVDTYADVVGKCVVADADAVGKCVVADADAVGKCVIADADAVGKCAVTDADAVGNCAVMVPTSVISLNRLNRSSMSFPVVSTEFLLGPHHCVDVSKVSGSLSGGVGVSLLRFGAGALRSGAESSRRSSSPFSIVSSDPSMLISASDPSLEPKMFCSISSLDDRVEGMAGSE
jgi:hypothetical protein